MSQNQKIKFKLGQQVVYLANKNAEPQLLTYVEILKNGLGRFFSSHYPALEYHISTESDKLSAAETVIFEGLQEKYLAFKGGDERKQQAYQVLLTRG